MHGLIKLADDCEIADYWYKKAKIDGLIKEDKTLDDLNVVSEFDHKIENYKTTMRIVIGEEEGKILWCEFVQHMLDVRDGKYEDLDDLHADILPIAYGVVTDYTLKGGRHHRKKVKVQVNFEEYVIKQEAHFFMEYMYKRWLDDKPKHFDVGTTIIDMQDDYDLAQIGRNLPDSYTKMESIFHSDELKMIQNQLFGVDNEGKMYCLVTCWDNM